MTLVSTFLVAPIMTGEHNAIHAVACFKQFSFQTVCAVLKVTHMTLISFFRWILNLTFLWIKTPCSGYIHNSKNIFYGKKLWLGKILSYSVAPDVKMDKPYMHWCQHVSES